MPGRYTSARYVGRESAFARLAAVLDDATSGRARAMLISGPAGVGISRFLDEAIGRIGGLTEPMRVLRGGAMPAGTDEPYGPVGAVRRTGARRALGRRARRRPRSRRRRRSPASCRASRPGWTGPAGCHRHGARARPNAGRRARSKASSACSAGSASGSPVVLVLEDLHRADAATRALVTFLARIAVRPAAGARRLGPAGHRPARRPVDQRPRVDRGGPSAHGAARAAAPRPRRTGGAHRGHRGRARVGQPAAPGRRAIRRQPARGRGAAGRPPRAADRLAHRLARRAGHEPPRRALPRVPPVLRLLAPAGRPLDPEHLAAVAADFEVETDRPAPRSVSAQRRGGGILDADLDRGARRGHRARLPGRARRCRRLPARADRGGRRRRPAAARPHPPPRRARHRSCRLPGGRRASLARGPRRGGSARGGHRGRGARRRAPRGRRRARGAGARPRPERPGQEPRSDEEPPGAPGGHPRLRPGRAAGTGGHRGFLDRADLPGDGLPRVGHRRPRRPARPCPGRPAV